MAGKTNKDDFSQRKGDIPKKNHDAGKNTNTIEEKTATEIINTTKNGVRQFANVAIKVLREELLKLGMECDITQDKRNHTGNYLYHINKKGVPLQIPKNGDPTGDGQILLVITKEYRINVRFNPYGPNPEYVYYHTEGLDTKDFVKEIPTCISFLSDGTVPSSSKLKKDSECNDRTQEDIDDILKGYDDDPVSAKPK